MPRVPTSAGTRNSFFLNILLPTLGGFPEQIYIRF